MRTTTRVDRDFVPWDNLEDQMYYWIEHGAYGAVWRWDAVTTDAARVVVRRESRVPGGAR